VGKVKLLLQVSGSEVVEVDAADWAEAKRDGAVAEYLDTWASDVETDVEVFEANGNQISWDSGEVIASGARQF
jgi:hypothetical protein